MIKFNDKLNEPLIIIISGIICLFLFLILNPTSFDDTFISYSTPYNVFCYQESANMSNQTGLDGGSRCPVLNYTGLYNWDNISIENITNLTDGNYSSFAIPNSSIGIASLFINYTKPLNSTNSSLWKIKGYYNLTNLTIPNSCFNQSILQLKLVLNPMGSELAYCYNSTAWHTLFNQIELPSQYGVFYDEAIWWNITQNTYVLNKKDTLSNGFINIGIFIAIVFGIGYALTNKFIKKG